MARADLDLKEPRHGVQQPLAVVLSWCAVNDDGEQSSS